MTQTRELNEMGKQQFSNFQRFPSFEKFKWFSSKLVPFGKDGKSTVSMSIFAIPEEI